MIGGGCRAGDSCPFVHDTTRFPGSRLSNEHGLDLVQEEGSGATTAQEGALSATIQNRRQAVSTVPSSRVVSKPIPEAQTQNPRDFQLGQIRRRFSPKETRPVGTEEGTVLLKFNLTPSDPDFPFELTALECALYVPAGYPSDSPSLKIGNKDIPRGFAINVENGFDGLVREKEGATLLELMKALDKNLEAFLSAQKADTVKIVLNKDTRHLSLPSRPTNPASVGTRTEAEKALQSAIKEVAPPPKPVETFTAQQKEEASKRRESETRQLEARMGRLPLYKKSADGIAYTLPMEPKKRAELPIGIRAVKTVQLFVPLLYPLQPCRIQLEGVDVADSKAVEKGFELKAMEKKEFNLTGHVNYLAQNMHILAKTVLEPPKKPVPVAVQVSEAPLPDTKGKGPAVESRQDADRSHIQYITRPPEWTIHDPEDDGNPDSDHDFETDTDDLYSYDTGDDSEEDNGGVPLPASESIPQTTNPERGTAISFPSIELYGIELLELVSLNLTVKCERCKDLTEIKGLKNGVPKSEICRKCSSPFTICFRRDFVHANAVRAGFLDLEGCVVGDMLPRYFPSPSHYNIENI